MDKPKTTTEILEKRGKKARAGSFTRLFRITLFLFFVSLLIGGAAFAVFFHHIQKDLPQITSLKDYRPSLITTVYSDDGRKIGEFFKERRIVVPLSQIPERLIKAFVAAEDARFYQHEGIDLISVVRAMFKNIEAGAIVQGGSTITQQVTKSFLLTPERSYTRKIKEAILSYRIDKLFSKDEILYLYLNQIYLGHGAYGVQAAAENYFGKSVAELGLAECALLAGLPQAPSKYSPLRNPELAKKRQIYVLNRMLAEGFITNIEATEAINTNLDIKPRRNLYIENVPFYTEHVRQYVEKKFGADMLYTAGLTIHTAVNIEMQKAAQDEIALGLAELAKRHGYEAEPGQQPAPQAALLCLETETGHVKAMVGGNDFTNNQFNRAVQSRRQPGSAFKPIIYAAALDKGYTPATMILDTPIVFRDRAHDTTWKPKNYEGKFFGPTLFRDALEKSKNIVTIKILRDIGIDYTIRYARRLGIESNLTRDLSMALGSSGVSLLELVTAYSVFANEGYLVEPVFVTKIVDRDGNVMEEIIPERERVIEKSTAYIMTNLLEGVVKRGTGRRVLALNRPVAGKTGTTNKLHDAWFVGYTPGLVTGTWVGFDSERSLGAGETGARAASPIWLGFMKRVLADQPIEVFQVPEDVVFTQIDADTGKLPIPESTNTIFECFKQGTVPTEYSQASNTVTETDQLFKSDM
ncbi:MAG: penicillin-binding protein 1A [Thermodesulfobacteriota bacterium]